MPWAKVDDTFTDHPKIMAAGPMASWLYVCGLTYCARLLTDGFIPATQIRKLADLENPMQLAERLVAVGLWHRVDDGFLVNDYLEYNPSAEQVRATRTMNATRKELYADPGLVQRIRRRDGDFCRYCGREVRWTDRKSPAGATYDHVNPKGGNSLENVVVACRGCNSSKGQRTPDEWGFPLLAPGTRIESIKSRTSSDLDEINTESAHPSRPTPVPVSPVQEPEPTTTARAGARDGPAGPSPSLPFELFVAICESAELDAGAFSARDKGKHLAVTKRLAAEGLDAAEARAVVGWLRSQDWRTSPVTTFTVEKHLSEWRAAGRPAFTPPARASPGRNGRRNDPDAMFELARKLQEQGR